MSQNVQPIGALSPQPVVAPSSESSGADLSERRQSQEDANRLARYRLVIEGEPLKGFVYKSVDRVTGEVVAQYPRESVETMASSPGYAQGSVIDTTA